MMRAGQGVVILSVMLLMLGVVMVNSAGLSVSTDPLTLKEMVMSRPAMLAMFAIGAMWMGSRFPFRLLHVKFAGLPLVFWLVPIALLLLFAVYVPGIGKRVNAANRWLDFGGFAFQPSEVAKWALVAAIAWWGATYSKNIHSFKKGFLPAILVVGLICGVIAVEDLGTAVLIFGTACVLLFAAGCKTMHFVSLFPFGIAALVGAIMTSSYRMNRLKAFIDPYDDPGDIGYHILQSLTAISSGGLAGLGLGHGVHKFGYLPEDTTDFIFSIICEELGVVGAGAVLCLYAGILILSFSVIRKCKDTLLRLLVLGIATTIGLQASINILVVTSLAPTKGIALPLLSNGGTGWLLTAFCIGLINAVDRTSQEETAFTTTEKWQPSNA
ncbi:MAG: FtsW/RodA/SpoVE family cell cycle protein [Planctomycetes bacterium]|nr:FtsW/RodA/SpoVE family cell cycle protein [Planctomycetota bacterium]